jgi:pilus assembly protein CpaE
MDTKRKGNPLLTSIVVSPQADRAGDLSAALSEFGQVRVLRTFQQYPSEEELGHFLQLTGPAIVFLGTEDIARTLRLALAIDRAETGAQVVVVGNFSDQQVLIESMQVGIREFLTLPLDGRRLTETVARIIEILERKPLTFKSTESVFSFLPAKPGDGASTVAVNVSAAIARRSQGKTLLADFDFNLGMVSFLLKMTNGRTALDALGLVDSLDEDLWNNIVLKRDNLDVLCSGRLEPTSEVDLSAAEKILHYARRAYGTVCLDLSGSMEPFTLALLSQSKEIFVVCTTDLPSLHFARAKAQFLRDSGYVDRASVIINRSQLRTPFSIEELEKVLGLRVRFSLPNDPRCVSGAMRAGTPVDPKSSLGRQFELFVESIVGETGSKPERKRRFIDFFAIIPSDYENESQKRR